MEKMHFKECIKTNDKDKKAKQLGHFLAILEVTT
jgi:hypothetical protein